jgi:hypothetical protein
MSEKTSELIFSDLHTLSPGCVRGLLSGGTLSLSMKNHFDETGLEVA